MCSCEIIPEKLHEYFSLSVRLPNQVTAYYMSSCRVGCFPLQYGNNSDPNGHSSPDGL